MVSDSVDESLHKGIGFLVEAGKPGFGDGVTEILRLTVAGSFRQMTGENRVAGLGEVIASVVSLRFQYCSAQQLLML